MKAYHVDLRGVVTLRGSTVVEVEDILNVEGNLDTEAMFAEATRLALLEAAHADIEWQDFEDDEVEAVMVLGATEYETWDLDEDEEAIEKETGPF